MHELLDEDDPQEFPALDGIPLAIEFAAARVRLMAVEEIAAALTDRFRLLTGGARCAPADAAVLPIPQAARRQLEPGS